MGRQGVPPGAELERTAARRSERAGLTLDGVMTHFCCGGGGGIGTDAASSRRQFEAGGGAGAGVGTETEVGACGELVERGNPSGTGPWLAELWRRAVQARARWCAAGSRCMDIAWMRAAAESRVRSKLLPVMTWKTRVLDVREMAAGDSLGYNATFTARAAMRVALLPVGYADGLRRELSRRTEGRVDG